MDIQFVGKMIRFHRKKSGLSQEQLGNLAQVGKTTIFDIEHGKLSIGLNNLVKILEVLNIRIVFQSPLMELFQEEVPPSNQKATFELALKFPRLNDPIMRKAKVFVDGQLAGELQEIKRNHHYRFIYEKDYKGSSISLTMPTAQLVYDFERFPPFFEGLLPEGIMLNGLLRYAKLDKDDYFGQLIQVGNDLVGNVTVIATCSMSA